MRRPLLLSALLILWAPLLPAADAWQVVHGQSLLGFATTQQGSRFEGRFEFTADMRFAADDLAHSEFDVTVDVTSVETGSRDRDAALAEPEFFWFEKYPEARFRTTRIEHVEGNEYRATAELKIRDRSHEVVLPFTWTRDGDTAEVSGTVTATMEGGLTMDRLRWDVGTGEWAEDGTIGRQVEVFVDLLLRRQDG